MFGKSFKNLTDQERHNYILSTYVLNKTKCSHSHRYKRDIDIIKEHHRFLWDDNDDGGGTGESWEQRLARKYYDKLFKEYGIADLSRYKENKVALRWRTEAEVIAGTGQFQCGSRKCTERDELRSWEVNFAYQEHGIRKNTLVKIRLCQEHSNQLNYRSRKREIKRLKRNERQKAKLANQQKSHKRQKSKDTTNEDDSDNKNIEPRRSSLSLDEAEAEQMQLDKNDNTNKNNVIDENIWSKKLSEELASNSRETEFENYLEDLLL